MNKENGELPCLSPCPVNTANTLKHIKEIAEDKCHEGRHDASNHGKEECGEKDKIEGAPGGVKL